LALAKGLTYQVLEILKIANFVGRQLEGVDTLSVDTQVLKLLAGHLVFLKL
jgi:hypothetical protein